MSAGRRAISHVRQFLGDSLTPVAAYERLPAESPRFLFESVAGGHQVSRYSFLGGSPAEVYRVFADRLEVDRGGETTVCRGEPLELLRAQLAKIEGEATEIPFLGGYVGYFGYDVVRLAEPSLGIAPEDPFGLPLAVLARIDSLLVFDHARQRLLAVANEIEGEVTSAEAASALDALSELVELSGRSRATRLPGMDAGSTPPRASLDGEQYRARVRKAQQHIEQGDIFQAVLARRFDLGEAVEPTALYRAVRAVNPSPYMVLLEMPELALVGASPEMLVRRSGSRIETRPIAGTRHRAADAMEDDRLAEELLADPKERAEHVMLVDLGRNDLGRVAAPGTVAVRGFMEIERYSHVMHICSSIEGELAEGRDALDLLLACFPAGTVSGAPKIRAMQLIDELEPEARGPYAGAIGYISYAGDLDTCITIRTLIVHDGKVSVTAGAGIVADSDPQKEERETESKAAALRTAVELARRLPGSSER